MTTLDRWLAFSRDNRWAQQFGQGDDQTTFNGATGCTHAILQRLIKARTGARVSQDHISQVAGYPLPYENPGRRGLRPSEVQKVLNHYDLPYRIVSIGFDELKGYRPRGPIMLGVMYSWWPEDRGYVYNGVKADGRPNGYAIRNGKTQLSGFKGRHAVLWLGSRAATVGGHRISESFSNEPNHGSASRPEKPDYDATRTRQIRKAYEAYQADNGGAEYAWIPTRLFVPKGY